jgi:Flp pilus assembly protein TadG
MKHRQPGQIMVLFALSLLGMSALMALILDGGTLYVQRRTAQNAADAAALAGSRALQQATARSSTAIASEICTYLLANSFGVQPTATAYFVGTNGTTNVQTIALPPDCAGSRSNWIPDGASGVHVDVTIGPYPTYMAGVVGIRQLSAAAQGTAQVAGVRLTLSRADLTPLAGCGPDMLLDGKNAAKNESILLGDGTQTAYTINPARYGHDYVLQGSQMSQNTDASRCPTSNGASWKGKIQTDGVQGALTLPALVPVDNGNGTIDAAIEAECSRTGQGVPSIQLPPPDACLLLVPIAAPQNPAGQAHIVLFGCFSMYDGGPGYEEWRGILHPVADCSYHPPYDVPWTWGMGNAETHVLLTT